MLAGQRVLRHPRRAARGQGRRRPLPGHLRRRPLQPAGQRGRRARQVENEDLVNVPNWLPLQFRIAGGAWFDVPQSDVEEHRFELDMRHGTLTRRSDLARRRRAADQRGAAPVRQPQDEHLAALATEFTAENWSGTLEVRSGLDGRVVNAGVKRYRDLDGQHLTTLGQAEVDARDGRPAGRDDPVAGAGRPGRPNPAAARRRDRRGRPQRWSRSPGSSLTSSPSRCEQGRPATVEKIVALYTSRDRAISESRHDAAAGGGRAPTTSRRCSSATSAPGSSAWNRFDIAMDSANEWTETVLHLHIFHLLQTVSPHTTHLDVGVPARGWHGEAYRGHIFWDELFIFPFLNFQRPSLAGALLEYRYARLGRGPRGGAGGRVRRRDVPVAERLQRAGGDPADCTSTRSRGGGCPTTRTCSATSTSRSPTTSGSTTWSPASIEFLRFTGAELLIEIARFWASVATYNAAARPLRDPRRDGPRRVPRGLPGLRRGRGCATTPTPTSWRSGCCSARWRRCESCRRTTAQELVDELTIRDEELDRWRDISPQDDRRVPRRRRAQPVRGLRAAARVRLGGLPGASTATSSGWTGCSRPRVTARTGTRSPSRPTC